MMRTKITVATLLGLMLTGCSADGGGATATATDSNATESETESDSDDEDSDENSNSNTNPSTESETENPTTTDTTLTTDPDSSSTEPAESSSGGDECTPQDICDADDDCAPGQTCTGCLCFGEGMGCAQWGEGAFGDCVTPLGMVDNSACMSDGGACLVDDPAAPQDGVCFFDCTEPCDCPEPPDGFDEQVACMDLTGEGTADCFIDCGGGADCPEGMYCFAGTACFFGDAPMGLPPYSDCVNIEGQCEAGTCIVDDPANPVWGACSPACEKDADCPDPGTGEAAATCTDISGEGDFFCILPCNAQTSCPDGMACEMPPGICSWDLVPPWGDCENGLPATECLPTDQCVDTPEGGICGSPCEAVGECPDAPDTGTAVVECDDLGAGDVCHLSCAMGETCPDGMTCFDTNYCHFATL